MAMKKELDPTALRFLGVQSMQEVRVIEGQQAKEEKLRAQTEKYLLEEACGFGDSLVNYVTAHSKEFPPKQLIWGTVLGTLCLREDYLDGVAKFDELADQGGKDLQLNNKSVEMTEEQHAEVIRKAQLAKEEALNAAKFAELYAGYVAMKKRQTSISNIQIAYGLGRAFHNLRLTFPEDEGGRVAFDELARQAGVYFDANKGSS